MIATRIGAGDRDYILVSTTATYDETADVDLIAIEYVINGQRVTLTQAEKIYAARLLDDRGLSMKEIGRLIGSDPSTIQTWKDNGWKPGGRHPKTRKRPPRPEPKCGEPRMYRRHLKAGESCDICRAANAAADRRYRATGSQKPQAA
ncbi:helix-turn-helix domain-containing protein [Streptomyces rochei]|uniref:helix-turn-helix domain-containing protein n=1 Tax=Streptomyces rochei TaxID=1928 RepID=UPI002ACD9FD9|nr:helix-turn-helix domain-containing protein [Streptomyces rochei]WQC12609.1 helix-turn-helix domain-containing protein [Streptomyces rochei]